MKKTTFCVMLLLAIALVAACSSTPATPPGPADVEREQLMIYLDGEPLAAAGYAYADIKDNMADKDIDGTTYYGATAADITGADLATVQGAFLEAVDGYISYVASIDDLYLAAFTKEGDEYQSIELDGKAVYGGAVAGGNFNKGVVNVYLVTTAVDFSVDIQKDGLSVGSISIKEFMQKTPVGDAKVATGMFEGAFLYNSGENTHQGRFLGLDYETMLAKLAALGMDIDAENIVNVEFTGITGKGSEGLNTEYSDDPDNDKYFGSVDFFCMYDGLTFNKVSTPTPIGLTAFINGTGSRWMTYNLTSINFITK